MSPLLALALVCADGPPAVARTKDVIYGRKFGVSLTLDVFAPARKNGLGVIVVVSGGWKSDPASLDGVGAGFAAPFCARGYTVFAVCHGCQPKFTLPEILDDMHRAVRYIRHHAKTYEIDPDRIGVTGGSAGGHLSLMLGLAPRPGDPKAADPVDRTDSRVAAVGCFYPPTDFLNYARPGRLAIGDPVFREYQATFDVHKFDKSTGQFERVTEPAEVKKFGAAVSPVTHVDAADPPVLVIHGDADTLVPLQQAELLMGRLKDAGVTHKLVVKPGAGHGWPTLLLDVFTIADWFDAHLKPKKDQR